MYSIAASANNSVEKDSPESYGTINPAIIRFTGTPMCDRAAPPKNTASASSKLFSNDNSPLCHLPVAKVW